jgi:hypothetical protein
MAAVKRKGGGAGGERPPQVIRRAREDRKRLPAELEAFAGGDDDALWRRERRRRLDDPRPVAASSVPGVANRDARLVYEARVKRLRAAIENGDETELATELAEAVLLAVWRGNAVVGFDVFAEAVLGIDPQHARKLVKIGAAALDMPAKPTDETLIALWMRAESGLLEVDPSSRVTLRDDRLLLEVPVARAAEALAGVGRRSTPLAKLPIEPETVVDRPRGVAPLSKLIERDRPTDD